MAKKSKDTIPEQTGLKIVDAADLIAKMQEEQEPDAAAFPKRCGTMRVLLQNEAGVTVRTKMLLCVEVDEKGNIAVDSRNPVVFHNTSDGRTPQHEYLRTMAKDRLGRPMAWLVTLLKGLLKTGVMDLHIPKKEEAPVEAADGGKTGPGDPTIDL